MKEHPFYRFLKSRGKESLPGREAQLRMAPVPLDPEFVLPHDASETAHPSSVLIPLYPDQNEDLHVILTLRTTSIRHAGQISFPGGRREKNETLLETALRETEEEIGVKRPGVKIACSISPLYLHRTDNQITPFVGFLEKKPQLVPNPAEVQEVFTTALDSLVSENHKNRDEWHLAHASYDVPYWSIHRVPLWGATAMIMNELLELYREFKG